MDKKNDGDRLVEGLGWIGQGIGMEQENNSNRLGMRSMNKKMNGIN